MNMRTAEPVQESKYLQSTVDGYCYIWTKQLAERDDMRPCDKIPDKFKKEQNYATKEQQKDIRFMKKGEVMEEARVVYGVKFDRTLTAQRMKIELRKMRKGTYGNEEDK